LFADVFFRRSDRPISDVPNSFGEQAWGMRAPVGPAPSVDVLCARWRAALDAEEEALRAAAVALPAQELALRRARLGTERTEALRLLKSLARDEGESCRFLHLTPRRDEKRLLGLPAGVRACVFNIEGILVASVALHVAAWTQAFDEFVYRRAESPGGSLPPFDPRTDYVEHIHGKPRLEGVHSFLVSHGIRLPEGDPDDPPGAETAFGIANRKNELLRRRIDELGVSAYEGSWQYLETALETGVHTAVVSASANTRTILQRAGLAALVEGCIDGNIIVAEHLRESPAPDRLLAACREVGVDPGQTAVFETSANGVAAAHAGHFGFVVAVDQTGRAGDLRGLGANLVVHDLAALLERRLAA
jgi:beta-phosphoglucomutase-like phosphatase (HAD superfamily)